MSSHRDWQRTTALNYRQRKEEEAKGQGVVMADHALDAMAAAYVGANASDVKAWRNGAL